MSRKKTELEKLIKDELTRLKVKQLFAKAVNSCNRMGGNGSWSVDLNELEQKVDQL